MFLQRSAVAVARRAVVSPVARRSFAVSAIRRDAKTGEAKNVELRTSTGQKIKTFHEIQSEDDLIGPGAAPGTVPTDLEQATGLERLEILGKMEGVDIFDMRPLDASRKGTLDNPIPVRSAGDEQYAGCTGYPADSHIVTWLGMSRQRPIERCPECGSVYKMEYVGPQDDGHGHGHDHHGYEEPKTFADYVKPNYW
ncbi:COX5B-domain-containing protein [Daldinia vernicosa]|uniref:COX5B-domain-containing protein n=1 Tax=Daldinia vernicosa TaxID=114800 RepID=UPI002007A8B5|nr:COX5B-domain-containing protein [Daldinia vernicosa]KAI0846262.1 COX5B-domain-containing protein [Daldinia vernicosa]